MNDEQRIHIRKTAHCVRACRWYNTVTGHEMKRSSFVSPSHSLYNYEVVIEIETVLQTMFRCFNWFQKPSSLEKYYCSYNVTKEVLHRSSLNRRWTVTVATRRIWSGSGFTVGFWYSWESGDYVKLCKDVHNTSEMTLRFYFIGYKPHLASSISE